MSLSPGEPTPSPATSSATAAVGADPRRDPAMRSLYRMSRTAGVGLQDYAAVNVPAVVGLLLGLATVLVIIFADVPAMLIVPAAAIGVCLVALVQILRSNGTQTGVALAGAGIVLAGLMAGVNLYRAAGVRAQERQDLAEVRVIVDRFGEAAVAGRTAEAYALFEDRFHEAVKPETFERTLTFRMKNTFGGPPASRATLGERTVAAVDANGVRQLTGLVRLAADGKTPDGRPYVAEEPIELRRGPGGWKIRNLPAWFTLTTPTGARDARE